MPSGSLITIPTFPPAPARFDYIGGEIAASAVSIFTGAVQINDWGKAPVAISFSWPPMTQAQFAAWVTFLDSLHGIVNYFAFGSTFTTAYAQFSGKDWRLKSNNYTYSVDEDRMVRLTFEAREA